LFARSVLANRGLATRWLDLPSKAQASASLDKLQLCFYRLCCWLHTHTCNSSSLHDYYLTGSSLSACFLATTVVAYRPNHSSVRYLFHLASEQREEDKRKKRGKFQGLGSSNWLSQPCYQNRCCRPRNSRSLWVLPIFIAWKNQPPRLLGLNDGTSATRSKPIQCLSLKLTAFLLTWHRFHVPNP